MFSLIFPALAERFEKGMSDEGAAHGGGGKRKRTCRGTHQGKQRPRNTVTQGRQASAERVLKEYWPEERVLPPAEDGGVFRFWPAPLSLDVVVSSSVFLFVVSGETDTTAHSTWRRGCFSVLGICPGSDLRCLTRTRTRLLMLSVGIQRCTWLATPSAALLLPSPF
jgi:hypothetical protein